MIEYQATNEELFVYLIDHNGRQDAEAVVRIHLKVQDYVRLDNGSAFLGFCQETANLANVTLIENWHFESTVKASSNDSWGGLSLDFKVEWPKQLVLSPDALEKCNCLFRFLFPIKRVQIELQHVWSVKVRSLKHLDKKPVFKLMMQLRKHMSFLVDNIYSYL